MRVNKKHNCCCSGNGYSVYTYDLKDTNGEVLEGDSANEINESISDALRNAAKEEIIDQKALQGYDKKEYAKMYFAFTGHNIGNIDTVNYYNSCRICRVISSRELHQNDDINCCFIHHFDGFSIF
ncbi:MAG: hypothetical protein K6G87_18495 [Butyrivibrio sp.]|uniref:hypothetical protein n=1 Tax=Butyrivibrio sp. TaxID=28121 RepID=UPI0025FE64C3|nr:hypothetical protein [Butyrivibrio sp.]MCR5773216.1 hypothetical protein [Butyrivibrio sp.]